MAKKKEEIEEAEVIQSKELSVKEDNKIILIKRPSAVTVNGEDISVELAKQKSKEALELKLTDPDDKEKYKEIYKQKQLFVKGRTGIEKVYKENVKAAQAYVSDWKSFEKEIKTALATGEEHLDKQLKIYDDRVEELERQRLAKIKQRTNTRIERLLALDGRYDPLNETYSFEYSGIIINKLQLDEFSDEEWSETVDELFALNTAFQEAEKERELAKQKEEAELKEAQDKLSEKQIKLRTKELNLNGAEFKDNAWWINGISFSPVQLKDLTDEEWDKRIEDATTVVEEPAIPEVIPVDNSIPVSVNIPELPSNTGTYMEYYGPDDPAIEDPNEQIEGINDPLGEVIAENVQAHKDHQALVDGTVIAEIEFNNEKPFIEFHIAGTSRMRIFPIEFETEATDLPDKNNTVINTGQVGDENLLFLIFKLPKQ